MCFFHIMYTIRAKHSHSHSHSHSRIYIRVVWQRISRSRTTHLGKKEEGQNANKHPAANIGPLLNKQYDFT